MRRRSSSLRTTRMGEREREKMRKRNGRAVLLFLFSFRLSSCFDPSLSWQIIVCLK
jgi:hypothetical protein